jgi:hypothetical protein
MTPATVSGSFASWTFFHDWYAFLAIWDTCGCQLVSDETVDGECAFDGSCFGSGREFSGGFGASRGTDAF